MSESTQEFVPYTRDQLLEKSTELAAVLDKLDTVREEKTAAMKDFKKSESDLSMQARHLSKVIRQKGEFRDRQRGIFDVEEEDAGEGLATPTERKRRSDA
ncbi:hypothetical protein [Myxococcus sp. CA040A]|uniref:hypothetical protein n=1 Tax=Myxococcus sp. CA040A TaxID=2741738 RepID=UPI00157B726E|nr:hypothetical protein [Myxococcus sp. CA040A]NTX08280.1 hypothetical protein [Myxococcus sp. CA040A]